jgi:uncharacterized protein (TIGR03437 family)
MRSVVFPIILLFAISCYAFGQTYTIQTFAGGGLPVNIPGTSARLNGPQPVAVDKAGNVFFADGNAILRMDAATGILTLVAGNVTAGFSGDNGPATGAQFKYPWGVAVDSADNVYIADAGNNRIRKVSNGVITTVAGNGTLGFSGDNGPATRAELANPGGVAVDSAGNLYITDNNRIRKVSNGVIATVVGNGTIGYGGDNGPAASAQLHDPSGVALDSAGNLYFADTDNNRIRKVSNGVITTVAGDGGVNYNGESGPATSVSLLLPVGVAVDSAGNLYIADYNCLCIRKVSNGVISPVAGGGTVLGDNGPATSAQLGYPEGVAVDSAGNLYISAGYPDSMPYWQYRLTDDNRIRKVSNGVITTVAGGGAVIGDNGPAASAQLSFPEGVAVDSTGDLYIADKVDSRVREVSNGVITTVAGTGTYGYSGDNGPATSAQLNYPSSVAADSAGNLYIADAGNNRIRKVSNGVITTVAGNGTGAYFGDNGSAASAGLNNPQGVAVDAAGNLYIADYGNNRIRRVSNGVITTVAGGGSNSGNNVPATSVEVYEPSGIAVDSAGNLYIAESYGIYKVSNGVITTVAGGGINGDNVPATSAMLYMLSGVAVDAAGNLYIADADEYSIHKVSNGVITTVAGNGTYGYSGDNGPATSAALSLNSGPSSVAVDSAGNVYIADSANQRVRVLTPSGPSCSASVTPLVLSPPASGGSLTIAVQTTSSSCAWAVQSLPGWISLSGNVVGSGPGNVTLSVAANLAGSRTATISIAGVPVTVNQAAPGNLPLIAGVSNAASGQARIAPNSFVSIYGSNFTPAGFSDDWSKSIVNGKLPTTLDGVSVGIAGIPAYVSFVSPGQINVLTPNVASGSASIAVAVGATTSVPVSVTSQQFSPAFFPWPNGQPVATHADYSWAVKNGTFAGATTVPARPGEVIILWGTGFGPTTPAAPAGVTVPAATTYYTANPVTVTIGSATASVYGTALASGFAGLYQVVVTVPSTLANGDYALVATVGGVATSTTTLTVHN